jgi:hypothetical protein
MSKSYYVGIAWSSALDVLALWRSDFVLQLWPCCAAGVLGPAPVLVWHLVRDAPFEGPCTAAVAFVGTRLFLHAPKGVQTCTLRRGDDRSLVQTSAWATWCADAPRPLALAGNTRAHTLALLARGRYGPPGHVRVYRDDRGRGGCPQGGWPLVHVFKVPTAWPMTMHLAVGDDGRTLALGSPCFMHVVAWDTDGAATDTRATRVCLGNRYMQFPRHIQYRPVEGGCWVVAAAHASLADAVSVATVRGDGSVTWGPELGREVKAWQVVILGHTAGTVLHTSRTPDGILLVPWDWRHAGATTPPVRRLSSSSRLRRGWLGLLVVARFQTAMGMGSAG